MAGRTISNLIIFFFYDYFGILGGLGSERTTTARSTNTGSASSFKAAASNLKAAI